MGILSKMIAERKINADVTTIKIHVQDTDSDTIIRLIDPVYTKDGVYKFQTVELPTINGEYYKIYEEQVTFYMKLGIEIYKQIISGELFKQDSLSIN